MGNDIDGEAANDWSGQSVALSADGEIVAVGACFNDGGASNAGHVRVYEWSGGLWSQLGSDIDGDVAGEQSGQSVALSSDWMILAVRAVYNNNAAGVHAGRVYEWSGGSWSQLGADINGEAESDWRRKSR